MQSITGSVGHGGDNSPADTRTVQALLNASGRIRPRLAEDGICGPLTIAAIREYQAESLGFVRPDGLIEPGGRTFAALSGASPAAPALDMPFEAWINPDRLPLGRADFVAAAERLSCEVAAIRAVTEVEAGKSGFLPSGRPKILFEAHLFSRATGGKYDNSHPGISAPKWDRALYRGGDAEYERLKQAKGLDDSAALCSASWGRFQILGLHYERCGRPSVREFIRRMFEGERYHLDMFVAFVQADTRMVAALQRRDWAEFARLYNGPGYKRNNYDKRMADAFRRFSA